MPGIKDIFKPRSSAQKCRDLCARLNGLGISAAVEQRGRPEELFRESLESSLGLVSIHHRQLLWANVVHGSLRPVRAREPVYMVLRSPKIMDYYRIWYGVRDPNLNKSDHHLQFRSSRRRSMWGLGGPVDVQWKTKLQPLELDHLNSDEPLSRRLIDESVDVEVMGFPDGYWIISNRESAREPSRSMFDCYEAVAESLLLYSKGLGFSAG